jgi:hypothetical protein
MEGQERDVELDRGWFWWGWHYYSFAACIIGFGAVLALFEEPLLSIPLAAGAVGAALLAVGAYRRGIT